LEGFVKLYERILMEMLKYIGFRLGVGLCILAVFFGTILGLVGLMFLAFSHPYVGWPIIFLGFAYMLGLVVEEW
jgi:hypothetical protein